MALRRGCSPVNLVHIFRIPFPKDTYGGLLLNVSSSFTISFEMVNVQDIHFT